MGIIITYLRGDEPLYRTRFLGHRILPSSVSKKTGCASPVDLDTLRAGRRTR